MGHWKVVETGAGLPSPLYRLEVRQASRSSDAIVVAFELDAAKRERVWGSAKLVRPSARAETVPAYAAEWNAGPSAVLLQLRAEDDGRLLALIRQRDRHQPSTSGEQVRQALLKREEPFDPAATPGALALRANETARGRPGRSPADSGTEFVGLFVVKRDGTGLRVLAQPGEFTRAANPAWSPDGKHVAFAAFDATGRDPLIRVVDARGGRTTAVAAGITPAWSRDGLRIAYVASGRDPFATDWNSPGRNDERIEVVRLGGPSAGEVEIVARGLWPRFAPNDDRLAFSTRREANWDIFARSDDGLRLQRLTDDPALDTHPTWTADGRAVVFFSDRGNRWDLYRVTADGRNEITRLTDHRRREEGAELSPAGDLVAFTDFVKRTESQVMILELASGLVHPLLDPPNGDRDPAWSPDGQWIAFVSRRPGAVSTRTGAMP